MRPRQSRLGIPYRGSRYGRGIRSFNEAEAITPRNQDQFVFDTVLTASFNEAEAITPRNLGDPSLYLILIERFNEAEAITPRNRCRCAAPGTLLTAASMRPRQSRLGITVNQKYVRQYAIELQ